MKKFPENLIKDNDKNIPIWKTIYNNFSLFPNEYPKDKLLKYSTNIPFLFACMDFFPHSKIVEFGTGLFSTPILYEYFTEKFFAIEDENKWFEQLSRNYNKDGFVPMSPGFYFGDPGPGRKLSFRNLTANQRQTLLKYYRRLPKSLGQIDFVFVDQVQYARGQSILAIKNNTKIIAYHDAQAKKRYNYDVVDSIIKEKRHRLYSYYTIPSWTNILIENSVEFDENLFSDTLKIKEELYFKIISYKEPDFLPLFKNAKFRFERLS